MRDHLFATFLYVVAGILAGLSGNELGVGIVFVIYAGALRIASSIEEKRNA